MFEGFVSIVNGRYRVVLEESWYHERSEIRSPDRHWYEQIPCRGGAFISLFSEDPQTLQLFTPRVKNARIVWEHIKNRPGVRVDFQMDGEVVLFFPPELLHLVADLAGASKKRRLSAEARIKLQEAGKATQFQPRICGVDDEETVHI
jgi:hypothetical protein